MKDGNPFTNCQGLEFSRNCKINVRSREGTASLMVLASARDYAYRRPNGVYVVPIWLPKRVTEAHLPRIIIVKSRDTQKAVYPTREWELKKRGWIAGFSPIFGEVNMNFSFYRVDAN